ncbi:MAG: pseudouridine synthase [Steroidobacteraceae bacterium]
MIQSSTAARPAFKYLLVNKPKGVVTTPDARGRSSVLELVPYSLRADGLRPSGRLDADASGLMLITDDREFAQQLAHGSLGVTAEYRATVAGLASDEQLKKLRDGMYLSTPTAEGTTTRRAAMESVRILKRYVDRARGDRTALSIVLREGQNREIRRMFARVGLKLRELERIAIGPLRTGDLKPGQAKLIKKRDVDRLRATMLGSD